MSIVAAPLAVRFVRVHSHFVGRLGVEFGIFAAVDQLRKSGCLSSREAAEYSAIDEWFNAHLPNPPFYDDGNSVQAVTWFKLPVRTDMASRVDTLVAILCTHRVAFSVAYSDDPGEIIYEDEFQVGVIPARRQRPTTIEGSLIEANS